MPIRDVVRPGKLTALIVACPSNFAATGERAVGLRSGEWVVQGHAWQQVADCRTSY
jgi:hypothetical protein